MAQQPALNHRCLVRAVFVQNQMRIQSSGHRRLDRVQKLAELDRAMPTMALAKDFAAGRSKGAKSPILRDGILPNRGSFSFRNPFAASLCVMLYPSGILSGEKPLHNSG